jgi:protein O-GlcNAc transferase
MTQTIQSAFQHFQAGEMKEAESVCREIIKKEPENGDALHLLGILSCQYGNYDAAIRYLSEALRHSSSNAYVHYNLGNAHKNKGEFDEAMSCYQKALQLNPKLFEAYHNLGMIMQERGHPDEAVQYYQKTLQLNPYLADAYYNMGTIFQDKGLQEEAITFYQKAVEIDPYFSDAYYNLGNAFREKRQLDDAVSCYEKAIHLNPESAAAYYNLGVALEQNRQLAEAVTSYEQALQIDPNLADAYNKLGNLMVEENAFDKAAVFYRQALGLRPEFIEALVNLGNMMKNSGKIEDAEKWYRMALAIKPDCSFCHQNLLFMMHSSSRYDARAVLVEHLRFAKQFEAPLLRSVPLHPNTRIADRRLKVGYVSPDFRKHSVACFFEPVLTSHHREHFEVFCYSNSFARDEVTERIRRHAGQWRDIAGMPDEKAADLIRSDGIDILVDLAGHTAHNRLLVFARKPAPVQVSWIGYPATTGLSSMDYKIVDVYTDPPGMTEEFYSETLVRLPESFLCYLPEKDSPEIGPLPAMATGHITFGSFNNFAKVSPESIDLWTAILKMVPGSRLVIKAKSLSDRSVREYVLALFRQKAIAPELIDILEWQSSTNEHLETYNRIDISLDTFPYNGTTTTCEALWMGVPVVTLSGTTHASRVGASLLSNIGLPELIAKTSEEYVARAVHLAVSKNKLQSLRLQLRDAMAQSSLTGAKRFTANLEMCFRALWNNWCKSA